MYNCSIEICVTTALIKSRLIKSVPLANYEKFLLSSNLYDCFVSKITSTLFNISISSVKSI